MIDLKKEQAAFEARAADGNKPKLRGIMSPGGLFCYYNDAVQMEWIGWLARAELGEKSRELGAMASPETVKALEYVISKLKWEIADIANTSNPRATDQMDVTEKKAHIAALSRLASKRCDYEIRQSPGAKGDRRDENASKEKEV